MSLLEAELVERDASLKKKESLLSEKKLLEIKKLKSNQELSNVKIFSLLLFFCNSTKKRFCDRS